jgi:hypothetical protein
MLCDFASQKLTSGAGRAVSTEEKIQLPKSNALFGNHFVGKLPSLCKPFWDLHSQVSVEVSIKRFPNPIAAPHGIHRHTELREQICRDPSQWRAYAELQQQVYRYPRLWRREVISPNPHPSSLIPIKKLAAIIVALGFVFWLCFGVSTYRAPRASYPYYEIQKPVPAWSEPMPLEGNYGREERHN